MPDLNCFSSECQIRRSKKTTLELHCSLLNSPCLKPWGRILNFKINGTLSAVKQNKFISNGLCSFHIWHLGKSNFLFKNINSFYKACSCVVSVGYSFIINQCFSLMASAKVMAIYSIFLDKSDLIKPVYSVLEFDHGIVKPYSPALATTAWLYAGKLSTSNCSQSVLLKSGLLSWRVHQFVFCKETLSVSQ